MLSYRHAVVKQAKREKEQSWRTEEDLAALTAFGDFQLDLGVATPPEEISMDSVTGQVRLSDPPDVECHVCDRTKPQKSVHITGMALSQL